MPNLSERSLIKMGNGGLVVSIPRAWWRYYGLKAGDRVTVISNGELRIRPLKTTTRSPEREGEGGENH